MSLGRVLASESDCDQLKALLSGLRIAHYLYLLEEGLRNVVGVDLVSLSHDGRLDIALGHCERS